MCKSVQEAEFIIKIDDNANGGTGLLHLSIQIHN